MKRSVIIAGVATLVLAGFGFTYFGQYGPCQRDTMCVVGDLAAYVLDTDWNTSIADEPAIALDSSGGDIEFEGSTLDGNIVSLAVADVAQDVTATIPDVTSGSFTIGDLVVTHCTAALATSSVDTIVFLADRAYTITDIDVVWQVAESGGTVGIMPERLQGTEDVSAGDDLLTAAFDGTATANTVVNGTLTATTANLNLAAGNRVGLDFTDDTPGELLNVCVAIGLVPN